MLPTLSRFPNTRPGEVYRVTVMASLLFLLIAANNLIKILRDSIFLSQHSVSELPYLYILVAFLAGALIATYTKYTTHLSIIRLIFATNAVIVANLVFFWIVLTYFDPGWSHYAFYIWSAMVGAIAVAQLWTLASDMFTAEEGKRLFGLLAAGGTLGGTAAGFAAKRALELSYGTDQLLWIVAALFAAASVIVCIADGRLQAGHREEDPGVSRRVEKQRTNRMNALLNGSRYVPTIALLILLSVVVSTLIDFQFKAAAKQAYPSKESLGVFFSSYYAWLSIATLVAQVVMTGRAFSAFGLFPSLLLTPAVLLTGSIAILIWPSLLGATLTRMADATLRNSIHRSGMEIIYLAIPSSKRKSVKIFLDVVVERIGDATAGFIILIYSLVYLDPYVTYVHFMCVGLIVIWMLLIPVLRRGHLEASSGALKSREAAVEQN